MRYQITHKTRFLYSQPVSYCRNEACLLPRNTEWQQCLSSRIEIEPAAVDLRERSDAFGNRLTHFAIQEAHKELSVTAISEVSMTGVDRTQMLTGNQLAWDAAVMKIAGETSTRTFQALPYLYDSPFVKSSQQLVDYARPTFQPNRPLIDVATELMQRIYHDFTYDPESTTIATPLVEVLKNRRGVCQDFAHVAVGCLRSMGLAARYVSGYIETLPPAGQQRLVGADASHAWFSVYVADLGWVDFDPTNNKLLSDQHVTVAWGRDFSDVSPLHGVALGGGNHKVSVSVDVARQSDGIVFQSG